MCLKLLCRPGPHLQVFTEVDFLTIFRDYPIFGAQQPPRPSLSRPSCIANEAPSLLWVWGQTVGFVTAKWLYLRWHCPLRSGTILTPQLSSLGVKAATIGGQPSLETTNLNQIQHIALQSISLQIKIEARVTLIPTANSNSVNFWHAEIILRC